MDEYHKMILGTYNKQYTVMRFFALWELSPNKPQYLKVFYKIYFWNFLLFVLLFDFFMITQIILNIDSMEEVMNVLYILATAIAVLGKLLTIKIKNQSYENFFSLILNKNYLPQNLEEKKLFVKCLKLNEKVRNIYTNIAYSACLFFFMNQYISGSHDLPVSVYSPISLEAKWKYNLMYGYVCLSLAISCSVSVAFDTLSSSFFIHLKGQLDMLGCRLKNIGRSENSTQDSILHDLRDCMRYYNRISKLSHDIEYLVSAPISLQFACSVFVLIANFYAMSVFSDSGELGYLIKILSYQVCMLMQIFVLCYYANELSLKSRELSYNLYESEWCNWNKINRKMVLLMTLLFETPLRIASINSYYSFNLAAFTSIVNSSYSYFALLKRVNS